MTLKMKTIEFNKTKIPFAQLEDGTWVVPAKLMGEALSYAKEGRKFVELVTGPWNFNNDEVRTFNGEGLAGLKELAPELGVSANAPSMTFLTIRGVTKALLRSRTALAAEFRAFLVKNVDEVLSDEARLKLPVRQAAPKPSQQLSLPLMGNIPENLSGPLLLLEKAKSFGVSNEVITSLFMDLYHRSLPSIEKTVTVPSKKDSTQLVPVSNIQASSMTPNFDSIRGFFLTGHQKHPKFQDWISAEEIGAPIGKTADQVKKHSTEYMKNRNAELANNVAMDKVIQAGGYFRGVSSLVDENMLPSLVDLENGCLAVWYLMEDGKLVWRNYWSPAAVIEIRKMMGLPMALPPGQQYTPPNSIQAPAPAQG